MASCWTTSSLIMSSRISRKLGWTQKPVYRVRGLLLEPAKLCVVTVSSYPIYISIVLLDPGYSNSISREETGRTNKCRTTPFALPTALDGKIRCPLSEMQQSCYQRKQYVRYWLALQSMKSNQQESLHVGEVSIPGGGWPVTKNLQNRRIYLHPWVWKKEFLQFRTSIFNDLTGGLREV